MKRLHDASGIRNRTAAVSLSILVLSTLLAGPHFRAAGAELKSSDDLRDRLDLSGLVTRPVADAPHAPHPVLSPREFILVTQRALGLEGQPALGDAMNLANGFSTRIGTADYLVDPGAGRVLLDDARGYRANMSVSLSDDEAVSRARPILAAMGVDRAESIIRVVRLMRDLVPVEGGVGATDLLATKVVVKRTLSGIPLDGERVVLSFAEDGTLRKIVGRWHTLSYSEGDLSSSGVNEDDAVQAATEAVSRLIEEQRVDVDATSLVRIHSFGRVLQVGDEFVPVLVGRVELPLVGAGGTIFSGVDFPLNLYGASR